MVNGGHATVVPVVQNRARHGNQCYWFRPQIELNRVIQAIPLLQLGHCWRKLEVGRWCTLVDLDGVR